MNFFRSHFWYNKSQRNGILLLISLIFIIQFIYFFVDFSNDEVLFQEDELSGYQTQIDSLKNIQENNSARNIYPFNPNYITDFKGYMLGMSTDEIDNLLDFRKTGRFVNSAAEFQKVTKVSDSLLKQISPYFKFPEWVSKSKKIKEQKKAEKIIIRDLNTATESDLKEINGVGEKLAKRIIFRNFMNEKWKTDEIEQTLNLNRLRSHLKEDQIIGYKNDIKYNCHQGLLELKEIEQESINRDADTREMLHWLKKYIKNL